MHEGKTSAMMGKRREAKCMIVFGCLWSEAFGSGYKFRGWLE